MSIFFSEPRQVQEVRNLRYLPREKRLGKIYELIQQCTFSHYLHRGANHIAFVYYMPEVTIHLFQYEDGDVSATLNCVNFRIAFNDIFDVSENLN